MKPAFVMMAVAAGVFGLSGAASAEILTATFTGTVNAVYDAYGSFPPAPEGDTLVATYVFDLGRSTGSLIFPTGGFSGGPYGSFAYGSVTVDGTPIVLPTFATGEITGETQLSQGSGSVIWADVSAVGEYLDSYINGRDFAWNLTTPARGFSYTPTSADETLTQLSELNGDLLESDISQVTLAVSSSAPEPSTWVMMLLGFAGMGYVKRRASRTTTAAAA